jgi:hypothetical protein
MHDLGRKPSRSPKGFPKGRVFLAVGEADKHG